MKSSISKAAHSGTQVGQLVTGEKLEATAKTPEASFESINSTS
jgi:hypothetical protein